MLALYVPAFAFSAFIPKLKQKQMMRIAFEPPERGGEREREGKELASEELKNVCAWLLVLGPLCPLVDDFPSSPPPLSPLAAAVGNGRRRLP